MTSGSCGRRESDEGRELDRAALDRRESYCSRPKVVGSEGKLTFGTKIVVREISVEKGKLILRLL